MVSPLGGNDVTVIQLQLEGIEEIEIDDRALIEERSEELKKLENDLVMLTESMQILAQLVEEQGEDIDHVEKVVEDVAEEVEEGLEDLTTAAKLKRKIMRSKLFAGIGGTGGGLLGTAGFLFGPVVGVCTTALSATVFGVAGGVVGKEIDKRKGPL